MQKPERRGRTPALRSQPTGKSASEDADPEHFPQIVARPRERLAVPLYPAAIPTSLPLWLSLYDETAAIPERKNRDTRKKLPHYVRRHDRALEWLSLTVWENPDYSPRQAGRVQGMANDTPLDLLQGTLDMLVLKAVSLGPLHGYGVLLRIQQISQNRLEIQQGSLYPALYRLEHEGWIAGEWGQSENKRRARFYRLTAAGRRRLDAEARKWNQFADVVGAILSTAPEQL
jgi:PadR family transcriptional regulator, regulatory protein PadR